MNKIYTVFGDSGEYSEWRMWAVRAFDNKADADQFAETLNAVAAKQKKMFEESLENGQYPDDEPLTAMFRLAGDSVSEFSSDFNNFMVVEVDFGVPVAKVVPIPAPQTIQGEVQP